MSEVRANTISDAAGTGPVTLTKQYAAKAWVNFNGTGTIAARDSGNVSSLTDNGTGWYTVNFTSAFAAADCAVTATSQGGNISGAYDATAILAGSVEILSWYASVYTDVENMSAVFHGDLA